MSAFMFSITDQEALTAIVGKQRSRKALKPNSGKHKTPTYKSCQTKVSTEILLSRQKFVGWKEIVNPQRE